MIKEELHRASKEFAQKMASSHVIVTRHIQSMGNVENNQTFNAKMYTE